MKLWGGRFAKDLDQEVAAFTGSLDIDERLWRADIKGSIAHARMLGSTGVIPPQEAAEIIEGLKAVAHDIEEGRAVFDRTAEDVHSEIERLLREKIGAVAGKLHTARSRNDQVATATRLEAAETVQQLQDNIRELQKWLLETAENETETLLPGLTHFQHAQPVSLAHHLMAYFWMLERDHERLGEAQARCRRLPWGAAALAGTSFALDRETVAQDLGFLALCENSLDAVSDRDFVIEILADASLVMMHLSRLCEEIIIWSAPEHAYLTLDDSVTTGSSIMPQKKNPDVAEIIRGRTGRAYGALMGALTMMKSLPLAYNRDMQEDKLHLFQGLDTAVTSVRLMLVMLRGASFDRGRMSASLKGDFSNATDLADDLASKGVPFREAHEVVGHIVRSCLEKGRALETLGVGDLKEFHAAYDEGSVAKLSHIAVMSVRTSRGGAAPAAVKKQIAAAKHVLGKPKMFQTK